MFKAVLLGFVVLLATILVVGCSQPGPDPVMPVSIVENTSADTHPESALLPEADNGLWFLRY